MTCPQRSFGTSLAIRYGHEPSICDGCRAPFSLQHGLDCHKGGLIKRGHNDLRDSDARLADHTCQPYQIFRENHGKLTSIPVYRGIYKIYRIFKKSSVPPQTAIVHVRSTLNHVLTRYYHEYLPAFYSKSASIWLHVD